jgi:hypothetical protein
LFVIHNGLMATLKLIVTDMAVWVMLETWSGIP